MRNPLTDWEVLSRPASSSNNIFIYDAQWPPGYPEDLVRLNTSTILPHAHTSTSAKVLPPPPPTSERPNYRPLYTSLDALNDDILLTLFNYYRRDDEKRWLQLGWCKLAHVCRRWRHLIYGSASYLDVRLLCTNGSPGVDTLAHLPPLPLVIDYQFETATIDAFEECGISHALQLRDRVCHAVLRIPLLSLHKLLDFMGEPFPSLSNLSLSLTADEDSGLILPKTFMAPNLRHLTLSGIGLPGDLALLSTASLVTLTLANIRASGYFPPKHLVALLRSSLHLEELSISFSVRLPRPSSEWELFHELGPPVTLPILKSFVFRGGSAYLDSLIAQMRAPRLQILDIAFFNQLAFAIPHLAHFADAAQAIKLPVAEIIFDRDIVSVNTGDEWRLGHGSRYCSLHVMCEPFDWQIDCAAQICGALVPVLSSVQKLTLDSDGERRTIWPNGAVGGVTWLELLKPFVGARELNVQGSVLAWELSRALQLDDVLGLDPELLLALSWLVHETHIVHTFAPFNSTRQNAARRVPRLTQSHSPVHPASASSSLSTHPPHSPVHTLPLVLPVYTRPSPTHSPLLPAHSPPLPAHSYPSPVYVEACHWKPRHGFRTNYFYRWDLYYMRMLCLVIRSPRPILQRLSQQLLSRWDTFLCQERLDWAKAVILYLDMLEFELELEQHFFIIARAWPGLRARPYVPPVRVEQGFPLSRIAKSVGGFVKAQSFLPKHIRRRIRPSHTGIGSAWR